MLVATLVGTRRWPAAVDGWLLVEPTPEQRKLIALPEGPFTRKMMIPFAVALLLVYGFSLYRSPAYAWIAVAVFVAGFAWLSVSAARYDELARRRSELMNDPARVRSMRHLSFRVLRPDLAPSGATDSWQHEVNEYFTRFAAIDEVAVGISAEVLEMVVRVIAHEAEPLVVSMGYHDVWQRAMGRAARLRIASQQKQEEQDAAMLVLVAAL